MLKVLTGSIKGRKLKVPKGKSVRPTTSRVKKSIFDTLGEIKGLKVLDVFSGSGGLGIEAMSRGAEYVTFIEKNPQVFKVLCSNITQCGFIDKSELICSDYLGGIKRLIKENKKFDIVFVDPPYDLYSTKTVYYLIDSVSDLIAKEGLAIIEHDHEIKDQLKGFTTTTKPFGGTKVSYFVRI